MPGKVRQPFLGGFELIGKRAHAVAMRSHIGAAVGLFFARLVQRAGMSALLGLCLAHIGLKHGYAALGGLRVRLGPVCRINRIAPPREYRLRFGNPDLVGQLGVAFRLFGLPTQGRHLRVQPGHQVFETGEIGFRLPQLRFRVASPDMQTRDPGCFFQHFAALRRFRGDDLRDLSLTDEGGRMGTGGGIGEGQRDILRPRVHTVEAIGTAGTAFDTARYGQLVSAIVRALQYHFGKIAGRALRRAGEDHVLHSAGSHRLGRIFAHDPSDRFEEVGLAAAVGPDDPGQAGFDMQFGRFDEAFETREF